ncbi:uncharacterized protein [Littorina saxatilis]|uniref:uncharacterized protein n=1 Tax=Littorina saxatilis TaxID=31220 RepID=UPI0038B6921E
MIVPRSVPSAVMVATVILLSHTGVTLARTLGLQSDNLSEFLSKRNSWWSKKSVDSSSDFTPVVPEIDIDARDLEDRSPDAYTQLYGCYTSSCVPDFIGCAARSRTTSSFEVCKLEHRACAMHCWELANDDDSSMK